MPADPSDPNLPPPIPGASPEAGSAGEPLPPPLPPMGGPTRVDSGRVVDPNATPEQRNYCVMMHLTLLLAYVIPVISLIAPIVMWQVKRHESGFVDDHGRETVNFHISLLLYGLILTLLGFVTCGVGWFLIVGVLVLGLVGMIIAAVAASKGEIYRYPMCIRFFS